MVSWNLINEMKIRNFIVYINQTERLEHKVSSFYSAQIKLDEKSRAKFGTATNRYFLNAAVISNQRR